MARKPWLFPNDYGPNFIKIKKFWFWAKAFFGAHSWLIGHVLALFVISKIVIDQIFR